MPGFKGKRKEELTLTLYKKPFRYSLPVSPLVLIHEDRDYVLTYTKNTMYM